MLEPSDATGASASSAAHQAQLLTHFGAWHAPIPDLISRTDPASILREPAYAQTAFPPFFQEESEYFMRLPVTLLGDAAHGVDPILAQGAGVAIEDAYRLAYELADDGKPLDYTLGRRLRYVCVCVCVFLSE